MDMLQIAFLSLIQGLTEFLPVSSSGHLALVPLLTDWPDQGMTMDIAIHIGSFLAICLYFHKDVLFMTKNIPAAFSRSQKDEGRLLRALFIGTLPVVFIGFFMHAAPMSGLRTMPMIATTLGIYGLILYIADRRGKKEKDLTGLPLKHALLIGLAQCLALVPGTSRSGITMTAALFLGYTRPEAARFSMLLALPAIAGAGTLAVRELLQTPDVDWTPFAAAAGFSFIASFLAIWFMMAWVKRCSFAVFAAYRILLSAVLFAFSFGLL